MEFVSSFAPGRVELLGNHTDYNEGIVLSAALDLGISARGRTRSDGVIAVRSQDVPETASMDLAQLAPTHQWTDYPLGVAKVLRDAGLPIAGFEAEFSSTLPVGAGLSSSAAIEVCSAVLQMKLFNFKVEALDLARLCRKAENEFVGVNCGLLDQVSSIFGKKGRAIYLDCRDETVESVPFPAETALLIIHSGVKHALTGGEYNERREQCFAAAELMGVPALRDVTPAQLEAAELPDLIKRRARHIVGENDRVAQAVRALEHQDAATFGRLMKESHRSSRENFENSTSELDALVELVCAEEGVYGARLTGGGFGGAIVALVREDAAARAARQTLAGYAARTGHTTGAAYHCGLGDGALALL